MVPMKPFGESPFSDTARNEKLSPDETPRPFPVHMAWWTSGGSGVWYL